MVAVCPKSWKHDQVVPINFGINAIATCFMNKKTYNGHFQDQISIINLPMIYTSKVRYTMHLSEKTLEKNKKEEKLLVLIGG